MIFIATDILNPYKRDILSQDHYETLIDFLVEQYPGGFERPTDISVNGHEVALADYDIKLNEDDVIVLLDRAALPVGLIGGWFVTALANLAISVTLSYVANKLFSPDAPQDQGAPSSVYNLNSAQNAARYGSPIPIVYGKARMFPSMIVQPYYKFENDIEYLYHVMCIGQGTMTTDAIYIGDDEVTIPGDVQWKLLNKSDFYNIPLRAYGIHLNKTLSNPSNIEIGGGSDGVQGDETEKYRISASASKVEFDYMLPNGLFWNNDGSLEAAHASFEFRIYTLSGTAYTEVSKQTFSLYEKSVDAIQRTYTKDISAYTQDVYVSFKRTIQSSDIRVTQDLYVKRVKEIYPNEDFTQRYGDVTLLAVKIKATNAVSSAGQLKVNGYFTRTDVGNTIAEVLTDIYTNTNYGGGLSVDDLSFPTTYETVNCAYDSSMTIFDAMRRPALAQGYSLYLAGMDVILKKDGANAVTSAMYNEMNILRNSFKAQYLFKEEYPAYDGFKCTYIDGDGWTQRSSTYPTISTRPKTVDLFGVVDYGPIGITDLNIDFGSLVLGSTEVDGYYYINGQVEIDFTIGGVTYSTPRAPIDYEKGIGVSSPDPSFTYTFYANTIKDFFEDLYGVGTGIVSYLPAAITYNNGVITSSEPLYGEVSISVTFVPSEVGGHSGEGYVISDNTTVTAVGYDTTTSGNGIAEDMAKYLHKQDESRRKIVSFSTDIQGLVPQFLDKIMVSHSSLQWGEAGEVISRSVDDLVISDALEDLTGSKTIVFRDIDGSVSDPYSITITDATHITVTGMPAWVTTNTFYTIQEAGTAKEFLVIAVKPSGESVQIDCVNYDETIYE